jgi:hypothetical protein
MDPSTSDPAAAKAATRPTHDPPSQPLDDSIYLPLIFKGSPPPPTDWLGYFNYIRGLGALPALIENPSWSDGCVKHSRYMVKNDVIEHNETPGNPWYTPEGQAAAQSSNLMVSSSMSTTDIDAIDGWMTAPFHGVGMIDPELLQTGFGSYREAIGSWRMGACLDVLRGDGIIPPSVTFPVRWPGSGAGMPYTYFNGSEFPDPLTSCPGYSAPTGPPVYLLVGTGGATINVTAHSFSQGATPLAHCMINETNYSNPNASYQSLGRAVLGGRDAIVIIPRNPLASGASYTVSITNNGATHTWTFSVSSSIQTDRLTTPALIR